MTVMQMRTSGEKRRGGRPGELEEWERGGYSRVRERVQITMSGLTSVEKST